jgi:hypothetical protein
MYKRKTCGNSMQHQKSQNSLTSEHLRIASFGAREER